MLVLARAIDEPHVRSSLSDLSRASQTRKGRERVVLVSVELTEDNYRYLEFLCEVAQASHVVGKLGFPISGSSLRVGAAD